MIIPEEIRKKWKELRSQGDNEKIVAMAIAKGHNVQAPYISRAFDGQYCSDELFAVLKEYYMQKFALVDSVQKELNSK
jgi:hypothetical protein